MEEDKYPVVYYAREIRRVGAKTGLVYQRIGYIVSKAYLKRATITFGNKGDISKRYEVEPFGYEKANKDLYRDSNKQIYLETGYFLPTSKIYKDAYTCKKQTTMLNEKLLNEDNFDRYCETDSVVATIKTNIMTLIDNLENEFLETEEATQNYEEQASSKYLFDDELCERTLGK